MSNRLELFVCRINCMIIIVVSAKKLKQWRSMAGGYRRSKYVSNTIQTIIEIIEKRRQQQNLFFSSLHEERMKNSKWKTK